MAYTIHAWLKLILIFEIFGNGLQKSLKLNTLFLSLVNAQEQSTHIPSYIHPVSIKQST